MGLDMFLETEKEQIMYWRKANQIHGWFINNCAKGDHECTSMSVTRNHLTQLLLTIQKVLLERTEEIANELLPPTPGFFFGSNEVDEYYWSCLEETEKVLTAFLAKQSTEKIKYIASW